MMDKIIKRINHISIYAIQILIAILIISLNSELQNIQKINIHI